MSGISPAAPVGNHSRVERWENQQGRGDDDDDESGGRAGRRRRRVLSASVCALNKSTPCHPGALLLLLNIE